MKSGVASEVRIRCCGMGVVFFSFSFLLLILTPRRRVFLFLFLFSLFLAVYLGFYKTLSIWHLCVVRVAARDTFGMMHEKEGERWSGRVFISQLVAV